MIRTIIDYIKELFDPCPIKCNRFTLTKEQYEELHIILENAYEHKQAGPC